jgi:carbon monoxide dehydrogenase subunit G
MASGADPSEGWKSISQSKGVQVWSRDVPGSPVAELRARGTIDAPPEVVLAVLADVDAYAETMPHTSEGRVLRREGNEIWAYQVIDAPLTKKRDTAVKITLSKLPRGGYATAWVMADDGVAPRRNGVVRLTQTTGSWRLEPTDGGKATFATYVVHTDPGGGVPKWVVNKTQKTALPDIFEAVRKAAKTPKYKKAPLAYRASAEASAAAQAAAD